MNKIEKICRENPGMTAVEIAREAGVSRARVYQVLSAAGLKPAVPERRGNHEVDSAPHPLKVMRTGQRMTSSFRGDMSEILVAHDLLSRGYYVYRSLTGNAPFDLLAYESVTKERDPVTLRVEVKSGTINKRGAVASSPTNHEFDVIAIADILTKEIVYRPPLP